MKEELNIYTKKKFNNFIYQLFNKYKINCRPLDLLPKDDKISKGGVIFTNVPLEEDNIFIKNIRNKYIIISNQNIIISENNKNITYLKSPVSIGQILDSVKELQINKETTYKDILILNKIITNTTNKKSCNLTDIENSILVYLIEKNKIQKNFFKEEVLNINADIQTNSLDSHLSRIRKKLDKIKTAISLKSQGDYIILSNSINQD